MPSDTSPRDGSGPDGPGPPVDPGDSGVGHVVDVTRFSEPRRLHPASILLGLSLKQLIQLLVFPLAASPAGVGPAVLVLAAAGLVGLTVRFLAWQRFRFSFDGEVLRVEEGVLARNQRTFDVDRIQQVEVSRTFLQRAVGLAALRVETAGSSSEVEAELRVLPEDDARALRAAVRHSRAGHAGERADGAPGCDDERGRPILRVPLGRVVLSSITGVRLLVFPAVIGGIFQFFGPDTEELLRTARDELLTYGFAEEDLLADPVATAVAVAGGVIVLSLVTAVAVGVVRDFGFVMMRVDDDLHVSRGLIATRDSVVPYNRIQIVQVHRNWIRRLLGFTAVRIFSAGGSTDAARRVTIPYVSSTDVDHVVRELYPGSSGVPALTSHPAAASRRAILRWVRLALVAVVAVWVPPVDWLGTLRVPVLALLPGAVALGLIEYRQLAHGTADGLVASRSGALTVATKLSREVKVQAVTTRSNWFQRRLRLATVRAHIAGPGGTVEVVDVGEDEADSLHATLTRRSASSSPAVKHTTA